MRGKAALLVALLAIAITASGVFDTGSRATTRAEILLQVNVTITDRAIHITEDSGLRGHVGEFHVVNASTKPRNLAVGTRHTDILKPGDEDKLIVDFTARGPIPYRVTLNCDPRLSGTFTVT
jgi:hypothetical protein